jgi:hypothetical protein
LSTLFLQNPHTGFQGSLSLLEGTTSQTTCSAYLT